MSLVLAGDLCILIESIGHYQYMLPTVLRLASGRSHSEHVAHDIYRPYVHFIYAYVSPVV